ncbi:MAG: hypothetical protein AAGC60_08835 [Acidobacteriota bacterium]
MSDFVDQLAAGDADALDLESLDAALSALRRILAHELRRRGLWTAPPRWLGLIGHATWNAAALDELVQEAYVHVFLDRRDSLVRRRRAGRAVEGTVAWSVRQFVSARQRGHDPIGARVYDLLHRAVEQLQAAGRVRVVPPPRSTLRDDHLIVRHGATDGAPSPLPDGTVDAWLDDLLVELVVAWHHGPVLDELSRRLEELMERVERFRFGDLLVPLRTATRVRWQALWDEGLGSEPSSSPDQVVLERDIVETLRRCIARRIDEESNLRRRESLWRLYNMLRAWAEAGDEESPPSDRSLAELLDIPRSTVGRLRRELQRLAAACRQEALASADAGSSTALTEGGPLEHRKDPSKALDRAALLARTRTALVHASGNGSTAGDSGLVDAGLVTVAGAAADVTPAPGDLLLLPLDAFGALDAFDDEDDEFDPDAIEWLVSHRADERVELVPVDSAPWLGSRDLRLDLGLHDVAIARLGLACRVSVTALAGAVVGAAVDPVQVDRVRQALDATPRPSTLARETDLNPEYRAWVDAVERLADRLSGVASAPETSGSSTDGTSSADVVPFAPGRRRGLDFVPWSLAAALALAVVGLGVWNLELRDALEPGTRFFDGSVALEEAQFSSRPVRNGPSTVRVDYLADASTVLLGLSLDPDDLTRHPQSTLELRTEFGGVIETLEVDADDPPVYLLIDLGPILEAGERAKLRWSSAEGQEIREVTLVFVPL